MWTSLKILLTAIVIRAVEKPSKYCANSAEKGMSLFLLPYEILNQKFYKLFFLLSRSIGDSMKLPGISMHFAVQVGRDSGEFRPNLCAGNLKFRHVRGYQTEMMQISPSTWHSFYVAHFCEPGLQFLSRTLGGIHRTDGSSI